ncbi:MAG: hypothetical protein IPM57_09585 [Oligoflexia bacterium]|nr:hypothetical protein [Oligoflexia bacterium]
MHSESALKIPLVSQLLKDPSFKIIKRAVDSKWIYEKLVPLGHCGFNPATNAAYVGFNSSVSQWLQNPKQSIRSFNFNDTFLHELFFIIHDYLHAWSYNAINELYPGLKFGYGKITEKNFEDYVFCHILTEAVATVGLDYWYLSTIELNQVIPVGANIKTLTAAYHVKNNSEYRRFDPKFNAQKRGFLKTLNDAYCDGIFYALPMKAIQLSPQIYRWYWHELTYGRLQRKYTRQWLSYLSAGEVVCEQAKLDIKIDNSKKWMQELVEDLSLLLWQKVKENKNIWFKPQYDVKHDAWGGSGKLQMDSRFTSLIHLKTPKTFNYLDYYVSQYAIRHTFSENSKAIASQLPEIAKSKNLQKLKKIFKNQKKVESAFDVYPQSLFMLP